MTHSKEDVFLKHFHKYIDPRVIGKQSGEVLSQLESEFFLKEVAHAHVTTEFTPATFEAAVDLETEVLELRLVSLDEVVDETTNDGGSSGSERKQELPLKVLSVDTGLTEFLFHKITHANLGAEEGDLDVEATIDLELKIFKVGSQILLSGAEETTDESTEGLSDTRSSSLGDCTEDRSSTTKEGTKSTEHTEVFFLTIIGKLRDTPLSSIAKGSANTRCGSFGNRSSESSERSEKTAEVLESLLVTTEKALSERANSLTDAGSGGGGDLTHNGKSHVDQLVPLHVLLKDVTEAEVSTEFTEATFEAAVDLETEVLKLSL